MIKKKERKKLRIWQDLKPTASTSKLVRSTLPQRYNHCPGEEKLKSSFSPHFVGAAMSTLALTAAKHCSWSKQLQLVPSAPMQPRALRGFWNQLADLAFTD